MGKNIDLCTNALRLEEFLDVFEPDPRLTFVVHLDGMREIHDYICDYPGLWDIAVDAIRRAREAGFRVTTNTTIFKETSVEDVIEMMAFLTNEVGIDGMLIAPGYQYSQIDPALTMTRAEHEQKFRAMRAAVREHGYRWLASPIYQDFLTGERELPCAPWGSITRNPYGWKGPCYLLTDGIFPTLRGAARGHRVGALRPGQRPALRALRHPLRLRAVRRVRGDGQRQGDRAEHGVDADGMTIACATSDGGAGGAARRAANAAWSASARRDGFPRGALVSFGLAGALHDGSRLRRRARRGARRRRGRRNASGKAGRSASAAPRRARSSPRDRIVDDPAERRAPARADRRRRGRHGVGRARAHRAGSSAACARSRDTPTRTLGPARDASSTPDGRLAWRRRGQRARAAARARFARSRAECARR